MRKSFEVKIYSVGGSYVRTLKQTERVSDINFDWPVDSGQGECEIVLDRPFGSTDAAVGNFVEVSIFSELHPSGSVLFRGQANRLDRTFSQGIESVSVRCLGLGSLLSGVIFESGGSRTFTKNQNVAQTVKDALDSFEAKFPGWVSYFPAEIESGPTANLSFDNTTVLEAVRKCAAVSGYRWRVDPDGTFHFLSRPFSALYKPKLQSDVRSCVVQEDGEGIVNRYFLTWSGGTVTAQDVPSQTSYGIREKRDTDTGVLDAPTAQARADAFVAANKDTKRKTSVVLSESFVFSDLALWDDTGTWDDSGVWSDASAVG